MSEGDSDRIRRDAQFAATRWSVVVAAQGDNPKTASQALADLCRNYWYPLYAYARRSGKPAHDAEDLTQAFFAKLLSHDYLASASREKGRFRTFLLTAMKRFLANEWDKEQAQKRGGGTKPISIDQEWAEDRYRLQVSDRVTPESTFERQWALTLLHQVQNELREDYEAAGKQDLFDCLEGSISGDTSGDTYATVGEKLGLSEGAVKVAAHRLRKRYGQVLREQIAGTVSSTDEVEAEIQYLFSVFDD